MLRRRVPSTNSLFAFETVARLGSFSEAATELNVTQPAISRSIIALEAHLGYPLFNRHGRWIELTDRGGKLFRATSTAFDLVSDTLREIEQRRENQRTVTISMSPIAVNYWFIPHMSDFQRRFPTVILNFREYSSASDSFAREVDLSIRLSKPRDTKLHRWQFAYEKIIALCSPQYLQKNGALDSLKKGQQHALIEWQGQRLSFEQFFDETGLHVIARPMPVKFTDYSSVIHAVLQGKGVALAWTAESAKQIIDGNLVAAYARVVNTGRRYYIIAPSQKPMEPVVEEVRDWLISKMDNDEKSMISMLKAGWDMPAEPG